MNVDHLGTELGCEDQRSDVQEHTGDVGDPERGDIRLQQGQPLQRDKAPGHKADVPKQSSHFILQQHRRNELRCPYPQKLSLRLTWRSVFLYLLQNPN